MRHERILLILILGELMLIVLGAVAASVVEPAADLSPVSGPGLTALWVAVVAGTLLGWIGLLSLLREARGLYLGSWLAYLALNFLRGPVVETPLGSVIRMLMTLVGGGILGLIYFSELRTRFRPLAQVARGANESAP